MAEVRSDEDLCMAGARIVTALGRRCAAGDPDTGIYLRMIRDRLDEAFADAVDGWRAAGYSDVQIGRELGVSRQAIQKRWPRSDAA